jgi:AcrR family transcriptional regulator
VDLGQTATRRRGEALETAILDAAWDQLVEAGYSAFTYEAVAARAGTSRPVLYRRWPTRGDLLIAAMRHSRDLAPVKTPNTGTVRGDMIAMLRESNRARADFAALVSVRAAEYFSETGTTMAEVRDQLLNGSGRSSANIILDQAAARGELDPARVPRRVAELPGELFRSQLLMTMAAVPDDVLIEIVDDIWLPLLRHYGATV